MQFCLEPRCRVLVDRGRCAVHARAQDRAWHDPVSRALYHSVRWQRLRAQVLEDDRLCVTCRAAGRAVLAVDVDHVRPHGGDRARFYDRANLQGLCKSCHRRKTIDEHHKRQRAALDATKAP